MGVGGRGWKKAVVVGCDWEWWWEWRGVEWGKSKGVGLMSSGKWTRGEAQGQGLAQEPGLDTAHELGLTSGLRSMLRSEIASRPGLELEQRGDQKVTTLGRSRPSMTVPLFCSEAVPLFCSEVPRVP